jgi:hypothetical protein
MQLEAVAMMLPEYEVEREFAGLLNQTDTLSGAQMARLAQLWEQFQGFEQAEVWWQRAAEAGDPSALERQQAVVSLPALPALPAPATPLAALPLTG